jgi:ribosomal protein L7/L12
MSTTSIILSVIAAVVILTWLRSQGRSERIDLDHATEEDISRLLMSGHKIDAIKVYRRLHGVDLKTAKEAVERTAEGLPRSA